MPRFWRSLSLKLEATTMAIMPSALGMLTEKAETIQRHVCFLSDSIH